MCESKAKGCGGGEVSSEPVGEAEGFSEIRDAREAAAMEAAECGVN